MTKITGYSRVSHHTITGTGSTFAVPPSEDFTDGTWNVFGTELCLSEIGVSETDNKAYIRIGSNIKEFEFVGGTAGAEGLSDTLAIDNNSGAYDVIMGGATVIKSANSGGRIAGRIALDGSSVAGEVYITTDDGSEATSYLKLSGSGQTAELAGIPGYSYLSLGGNSQWLSMDSGTFNSIKVELNSSSTTFNVNVSDDSSGNGGDTIKVINNVNNNVSSDTGDKLATIIGANNGSIGTASYNTVILGGTNIIANTSNSVYVPDLYIQTNKSIKSANGGGQIDLDYSTNPNNVLISSDNGGYAESFIDLQSTSINIGVDGGGTSNIQIDSSGIVSYGNEFTVASGNAFVTGIAGSIQLASGTYSTYVQGLQFRKSNITNSSATSSTIATIPMVDGETITIEAKVNAVCTSPNRNYGARLMAVFLKYGGNIYQTSTTDIVAKDGFRDGTTCDIDTDGTNVRIRVTNGGGLTTRWVTTYDYLQSN